MFDNYTEKALKTLFLAQYEASEFGSDRIQPEHLLLALFRQDRQIIAGICQFSLDQLRSEIMERVILRQRLPTSSKISFGSQTKRILRAADEIAARFNHQQIRTEHLWLGLLREQDSMAAVILGTFGVSYAKLYQAVQQTLPATLPTKPDMMAEVGNVISSLSQVKLLLKDDQQNAKNVLSSLATTLQSLSDRICTPAFS